MSALSLKPAFHVGNCELSSPYVGDAPAVVMDFSVPVNVAASAAFVIVAPSPCENRHHPMVSAHSGSAAMPQHAARARLLHFLMLLIVIPFSR